MKMCRGSSTPIISESGPHTYIKIFKIFMKFYIYVLKSEKDNSYYVGSTSSIEQRIKTHNSGNVISTRKKRPWTLIYKEEYLTLKEAIQRERRIKSWKKRRAIERLIKRNLNSLSDHMPLSSSG